VGPIFPVLCGASRFEQTLWKVGLVVCSKRVSFRSKFNTRKFSLTTSAFPRTSSFSSFMNLSGVTSRLAHASYAVSPTAGKGSRISCEKYSDPRVRDRAFRRFESVLSCSSFV